MKIHHQSVFDTWPLGDKSVQAIITSPPFWSLRKYDIPDVIIGGQLGCEHEWGEMVPPRGQSGWDTFEHKYNSPGSHKTTIGSKMKKTQATRIEGHGNFCIHCNAWKGQHGLEPTFQQYIEHIRLWAKEAWRVLGDDGVFFLNLGDSYSTVHYGGHKSKKSTVGANQEGIQEFKQTKNTDLPSKCKVLIPHRVAISLIDDGWILRNDIAWFKRNSMPESVTDRFSKKFEYIFMFVKSSKALCWRHAKTTKWTWQPPSPDYYYVNGKRRNHWQGFDYYFDLDMVREQWDEDSIKRLFRGNSGDAKYADNYEGQPKHSMRFKRANRTREYKQFMSGSGKSFPGHSGYLKKDGTPIVKPEGKNPGDLWDINTQPSTHKHYAMWPEKLVERMILCSTKSSDTVLDPFCGSGTTLRVADKHNRIGKGIDLGYQDIQRERLSGIQKQLL